ncbi:MAG TPA: nucleotide exchange factor GrpE [Clostridiales bacterium]|nr:nucleotide exchange factor GrpE [Clostridiales bacterium]
MDEELQKEKNPETESTENIENPAESAPEQTAPEQAGEAEKPQESENSEKKEKEKSFLGKKKQNAELGKLQQQNEALKKETEEWKDKYTRLAAEYDNYRKRTAKEIDARYDDAKADVWKNVLGILDDFERAMQAEILPECQNYKDGVALIYKKLSDLMTSSGIEEIKALHEPFNPEMHNAVMHIDSEEAGENEVVEVFMKGYKLGDRVIRHSMVKVAN